MDWNAEAVEAVEPLVPRHGLHCTVPAEASLLDALQAQGIEVLSECRRGECGLCVLDVLALDGEQISWLRAAFEILMMLSLNTCTNGFTSAKLQIQTPFFSPNWSISAGIFCVTRMAISAP